MEMLTGISGVAIVLLALLVVVAFVPGWVRDHNARQSQRYAIQLQQTMRALAETCERPELVDIEASARNLRAQRRELRRATQAETKFERERARFEAQRREQEVELQRERQRLETEQIEQELREQRIREQAWRTAAKLREAELETERERAEAAIVDAQARQQASARARAAAEAELQREAALQADRATAQDRWANGASGAQRADARRRTGEIPTGDGRGEAAARRRRGRLASTGVGFVGLILVTAGWLLLGGVARAVLVVLGLALIGGAAWMLQRIHRVAQAALREASVPAPVAEPAAEPQEAVAVANDEPIVHDIEPIVSTPAPAKGTEWTPVKLPKPLYLERATADELDPTDPDGPGGQRDEQFDRDLAALLHEEAAKSTAALREAHQQVESNRFATQLRPMRAITVDGQLNERLDQLEELAAEPGDCSDLDAVLRRRRAG